MSQFKVDIEKLRLIGWKHWDPIGLSDFKDDDGAAWPRDEYDTYLVHAANMFANGSTVEEVANYLYSIATVNMGLGESISRRSHSLSTAKVIADL